MANEQEMTITITKIIAFRHFHDIKLQKHVQKFHLFISKIFKMNE
jgi:hypothetical protein